MDACITLIQMLQDVRYALRLMARQPGFTTVVVLVLALAIGANTAMFSIADQVLIRPLPFPQSDRLVSFREIEKKTGRAWASSMRLYLDMRERGIFEEVGSWDISTPTLTGIPEAMSLRGELFSASMFRVLGVMPMLGRTFTDSDDRPGASRVVVISASLWQRVFGGDPAILGKPVRLDGAVYQIVGVMPPSFHGPFLRVTTEVWLPIAHFFSPSGDLTERRLQLAARLRPGVSEAAVRPQLSQFAQNLADAHPEFRGWDISVQSLKDDITGDSREDLLVLLIAVALILLIGCANLANVILTRSAARRGEMALRAALGASRSRLIRQSLTESLLLSVMGGAAGLMLAAWAGGPIVKLYPNLPRIQGLAIDGRVMVVALAITLITTLLFGLAPAFISASLREAIGSQRRNWGRRALVITETALSLILLSGAASMIKTFLILRPTDPGFRVDRKLTLGFALTNKRYATDQAKTAFYQAVIDRLQLLPGVRDVAGVNFLPMSRVTALINAKRLDGRQGGMRVNFRSITPNYFQSMGMPLRAGRAFSARDNAGSGRVVIVNETLARQLWPDGTALGSRLDLDLPNQPGSRQVVGIVADARMIGTDTRARTEMYAPMAQTPWGWMNMVITTVSPDPMTVASAAQKAAAEIDRDEPVRQVTTLERIVYDSVSLPRFRVWLMSIFAGLALVLAVIGIYGVLSYMMARRTREIAIRVAIGARPADILRAALGESSVLLGVGLLLGGAGAYAATRVLASVLYAVRGQDPLTFALTVLVFVASAAAACLVPAVRAMRIDPAVALRCE